MPLWAGLCDFILEMSVWWGMPGPPWYRVFINGFGYLLGTLVVYVVLLTLVCLTNRLWLSMGIALSLVSLVAGVNRIKLNIRSEPLYPSDIDFISQPRFLLTMVSPGWVILVVAGVALVLAGFVFAGRRADRVLPRLRRHDAPRWWWTLLAIRAVVAAVCLTLLYSTVHFNQPGNVWRGLYDADKADWRFWYQRLNYHDNGFIGGLLYNMPTTAMETPEGYSAQTMAEISDKYALVADRLNNGRQPGAFKDVNVVVVLSEAFSDPTALKGFDLDHDPIARTRDTMGNSTSGTMLAQLYGGGTANMEFEALTGQSLALFEPQMNTPYQMLVPEYPGFPSAVTWFEQREHVPVAVHPYFTGMYKRAQVYDVFGFDRFVHDTTMQESSKIDDSAFISDAAAFDEVRYQIDASEAPLFVNLVTMQNHVPVDGSYEDPIDVTGVDDKDQAEKIGQYARGVEHTDTALAEFLEDIKSSGERTVIVFYGDHQPGIYGEEIEDAQDSDLALYETPFFIWDSAGQVPEALPVTSPIHFMPLLFDVVGEPLPPFYALLHELRAEVPAMEQGRFVTPEGEPRSEDALSDDARELLGDLRLVQYDFSIGERYALDRMWYDPE